MKCYLQTTHSATKCLKYSKVTVKIILKVIANMIYFISTSSWFLFAFIAYSFNSSVSYSESDEDTKSDDGENESLKVK